MRPKKKPKPGFLQKHSLSLVSVFLLIVWLVAYSYSDPQTHWGAFFGNAVADWSGSVIIILGTKYLLEAGSAESKKVHRHKRSAAMDLLWRHSLSIFLGITGIGWVVLYSRVNPTGKWGQVAGNIVSEWLQMSGLVFLTKGLVEKGSEESK